jgi:hypothetical protein
LFKCNSTDIGLGNPSLNYTYCKDVAAEKWRNRCYTECAKLGNNSAICDYIPTVNERGACLDVWRVYNNVTTK